jgi:tetratricopeptide (TPR) repeat protein
MFWLALFAAVVWAVERRRRRAQSKWPTEFPAFDPRDADHHNALGMESMKDPLLAIGHFQNALEIKPDDAMFLTNLGIAQRRAGMLAEAKATLERAVAADSRDAKAHHSLANVLAQTGHHNDAVDRYLTALQLDPLFAMPLESLLLLLQDMAADVAREPGGTDLLVAAAREFEGATASLTQQFTDEVNAGYGHESGEKIGALFPRWAVDRMVATSALMRADATPARLRLILRLVSEAQLLAWLQAEMKQPPAQA